MCLGILCGYLLLKSNTACHKHSSWCSLSVKRHEDVLYAYFIIFWVHVNVRGRQTVQLAHSLLAYALKWHGFMCCMVLYFDIITLFLHTIQETLALCNTRWSNSKDALCGPQERN